MVSLELELKEVVVLSETMDEDKYKKVLEQFSKEEFVEYFLQKKDDSDNEGFGDLDDSEIPM